ncbi:MAG: hypothetical protein SEPTF4163_005355, partial [Sporothrix epigloea]
MEFWSVFSGEAGEDPEEYLCNLSCWAAEFLQDLSDEEKRVEKQLAFKAGLRGSVRRDWYHKLSKKDREWTKVQALFLEKFALHLRSDWCSVGQRVRGFRRKSQESVESFLDRADCLVERCSRKQVAKIRDCICYSLGTSDWDLLVMKLASLCLMSAGEMDSRGELDELCTYRTVRLVIEEAVEFVDENSDQCAAKGVIDSPGSNGARTPQHQYESTKSSPGVRFAATSETMNDSDDAG